MPGSLAQLRDLLQSRRTGYVSAVAIPIAMTYAVTALNLPPFVFEHLVVLLVVCIAIPWGLGPAVVTAVVSVLADDVLLREPVGRPTITGYRDVLDLALFATVAVIVSDLMRRAHTARRAAQEAMARERRAREERDRLVATVTHDLATPLAVLSGTVQIARRRGSDASADLPRLLDRLELASARATSLMKMLADARDLEADELSLALATHDLRTLVQPIVDMMDRVSERHPVVLAAAQGPVPVRADAGRLQRVIENLVSNAIKYSPDGGTVEVFVGVERDRATVRVRDHGIGISAEALPRIFEPAFRATEAARHAPGLGLGLSIAAQVIASHRGSIEAAAAEGGGTVLSVHLPLHVEHGPARTRGHGAAASAPGDPPASGARAGAPP